QLARSARSVKKPPTTVLHSSGCPPVTRTLRTKSSRWGFCPVPTTARNASTGDSALLILVAMILAGRIASFHCWLALSNAFAAGGPPKRPPLPFPVAFPVDDRPPNPLQAFFAASHALPRP